MHKLKRKNMVIRFKASYYGCNIYVYADNVEIVEDIEKREYNKLDNGKSECVRRDIDTDSLHMFTSVLYEIIGHRKAAYDSSDLIERLFEKLPAAEAAKLSKSLFNEYNEAK